MEIKNALDAILDRRSHRKYKPEQLTEEQLDVVLKAFDWAPTARNAQELRAIVIQDAAMLSAFAADFEAFCEQQGGRTFKNFYYSAQTFIILSGPKSFPFTMIDAGIAVENMAIAAEGIGLAIMNRLSRAAAFRIRNADEEADLQAAPIAEADG